MKSKIVYLAHPIGGDVMGNIKKLTKIVREINLTHPDVVPFVPYLADVLSLDDKKPSERERGINNVIAILTSGVVDELWVCGSTISAGMKAEIALAFDLNIPVKYGGQR